MIIIWIKEKVSSLGIVFSVIGAILGITTIALSIAAIIIIPDMLKIMFEQWYTYALLVLSFFISLALFLKKNYKLYKVAIVIFGLFELLALLMPSIKDFEILNRSFGVVASGVSTVGVMLCAILSIILTFGIVSIIPFCISLIIIKTNPKFKALPSQYDRWKQLKTEYAKIRLLECVIDESNEILQQISSNSVCYRVKLQIKNRCKSSISYSYDSFDWYEKFNKEPYKIKLKQIEHANSNVKIPPKGKAVGYFYCEVPINAKKVEFMIKIKHFHFTIK